MGPSSEEVVGRARRAVKSCVVVAADRLRRYFSRSCLREASATIERAPCHHTETHEYSSSSVGASSKADSNPASTVTTSSDCPFAATLLQDTLSVRQPFLVRIADSQVGSVRRKLFRYVHGVEDIDKIQGNQRFAMYPAQLNL